MDMEYYKRRKNIKKISYKTREKIEGKSINENYSWNFQLIRNVCIHIIAYYTVSKYYMYIYVQSFIKSNN